MARTASKQAKTRLTLEVPEIVRDRLEALCVLSHSDSMTEVFRRSLAVYDVLLTKTQTEHMKVYLRGADGKEIELLIM